MISVPFDWLKFPSYTLVRLLMFMFRLMTSVMLLKCACNESSFFNLHVLLYANYVEIVMTLLNTDFPSYFDVLLTVRLSIILVIDKLNAQILVLY